MLGMKKQKRKKMLGVLLVALGLGLSCFCSSAGAEIQDLFDSKETQDVYLYRGDLVSLKVYSLTRLAISTPGIIEIANADVDELLLIGQTVGQTALFIWDEYGKKKIMVRVFEEDLDLVMARLERLLEAGKVSGIQMEKNHLERKVVLKGIVSAKNKDKVGKIITDLRPYLIDMLVYEGDLVQIDVQISELSTTLQKALGIDWNTGTAGSLTLSYPETLPTFDGSLGDLFKIGDFARTTAIIATVNALVAEGRARVLSKPSILVTSGEQATFLVGGEIPVRTTTTSTGGSSVQENVSYTSYGVDVSVTPTIKEDKIDVTLTITIRDIDASNAVGETVAFTTRNASTKLLLNDGQTIVLAGLIKQNKSETMTGVPFLRRIPLLGLLFRNRNWPTNSDVEVVISMTPRVIRQASAKAAGEEIKEKYLATSKQLEEESPQENSVPPEALPEPAKERIPDSVSSESMTEEDSALGQIESKDSPSADESKSSGEKEGEEVVPIPASLEETGSEEVTIPAEVSAQDPAVSQAISDYVKGVQQRISQAISFPLQAKEKGWQGTVNLSLVLLSDGTLNDVKVKNSSGQEVFDKDALNTAKILAPFDPFPADIQLEELVVNIPIVYSQETVLEGASPKQSLPDSR